MTKEEAIKRATDLEAKIDANIEKVRAKSKNEAKILEYEERSLKLLTGELQTATKEQVIAHLESRLAKAEQRVEDIFKKVEGTTDAPTTAAP